MLQIMASVTVGRPVATCKKQLLDNINVSAMWQLYLQGGQPRHYGRGQGFTARNIAHATCKTIPVAFEAIACSCAVG